MRLKTRPAPSPYVPEGNKSRSSFAVRLCLTMPYEFFSDISTSQRHLPNYWTAILVNRVSGRLLSQ